MHSWHDNWPYFGDVDAAASYIGDFLRRWGRVPVMQTKEKFGSVRVYCSLGWYSVHDITHPGYVYIQYKGLFLKLYYTTLGIQEAVLRLVNKIVIPYHVYLYRLAHRRAIARWPHIRNEILGSPDWREYLEGL